MSVRVGLIGFGLAGRSFHAPLIDAEPRLVLTAVASSRADAVLASHPGVRVHPTAERLIADPGIELVVIATPNDLHAPLARAALMAGKHVVVDKPFVVDLADGAALIDLAKRQARMLSVFHNRRWDGDFLTVRNLLASGRLGDVRLGEFCWDRFRPTIKPGWREAGGDGGGVLADLGPHLVDQALQLFGNPDNVAGDILVQRDDAQVDDYFALTLGYGRCRVRLCASTLVASARPRFALHGTMGSFVKYGIDPQEAALRADVSVVSPGFGEEQPGSFGRLTAPDGTQTQVPTERGDWRRYYAGVAAAILDGTPPPVSAEEALTGLRIIDLARRSAVENGRALPF
ncbi:MAG: oxidoreductase [Sphingomonas sp.]|uniref:oxidoreductase n=1 Tax=Sphingomonas sp. TaxID=28214 RepID=UPI001AC137DD|nr:oxidoreductase [Sphingomonas sp.]MBN8807854.1 oxidoreductase [Sphingomonas sp.]